MIFEDIYGEEHVCEIEELMNHKGFFFMFDSTFPYATGNLNFPCDIVLVTESDLDLNLLEEFNELINEPIKYLIENKKLNTSFKKKYNILHALIEEMADGSEIEKLDKPIKYFDKKLNKEVICLDELRKDSYVELSAFANYIFNLVEVSQTYLTYTSGEDSPSFPGGCSGYKIIWDENPKAASRLINKEVSKHISILKNKKYM